MTHKLTRLTSLLLAVIMTFSMLLVPSEAASFTDVSSKAWYKAAVDYVYEHGWMAGTSETTFAPNEEVTRGMAVTVLARFAGAETNNAAPAFTDTPTGKWYSGAAAWAAEQGIVAGTGDGCFAPNRSITRQDLATILYQFIKKQGYDIPADADFCFGDRVSVSAYALEAVDFCAASGLMSGFEDSTFRPKATATRAQIAQILMRLDTLIKGQEVPYEPMPAQSFDGEAGEDMSVSVNAPVGALPENTEMKVNRVSDENKLAAIQNKLGGQLVAAADISFKKDGAELEPEKAVQVQISLDGLNNVVKPAVYHIKDDGTVEYVSSDLISTNRSASSKVLRFYASDFSIYAVVDEDVIDNHARMLVKFMDPGTDLNDASDDFLIYSVYVTRTDIHNGKGENGADINLLPQIIEDPTEPEPTQNGAYPDRGFFGWAVVNGDVNEYVPESVDGQHDINRIRQQVYNKLDAGNIAEGDEFVVYAMVFNRFVVSYLDENQEAILQSKSYFTKDDEVDIVVQYSYTPYNVGKARFYAWQEDASQQREFDNGADYTVTESVDFFALVQNGYYISFMENPDGQHKGASYRPPAFCENGIITLAHKPADPVLNGYVFEGWYEDSYAPGETFDPNRTYVASKKVTDETFWTNHLPLVSNTTLYAKWSINNESSFTVIVWKQKVDDGLNASPKDYDYCFSTVIDSAVNTSLATTNEFSQFITYSGNSNVQFDGKTYDFLGFIYAGYTVDKNYTTVQPGGITVVNVYYDRETVTLNFYMASMQQYNQNTYNNNRNRAWYCKIDNDVILPMTTMSNTEYFMYTVSEDNLDTDTSYYAYYNGSWLEFTHRTGGWYNSTYYSANGYFDTSKNYLYGRESISDYKYYREIEAANLNNNTYYYINTNDYGICQIRHYSGSTWRVYAYYTTGWQSIGTINVNTFSGTIYELYTPTITKYWGYNYTLTDTYQGLYGSTLEQNNYTWPETAWWYAKNDVFGQNSAPSGIRTTVLDAFLPASTNLTVNYYGEEGTGTAHVYFMKQDVSGGENYTTANSPSVSSRGSFYLSDKYNGFTCYQYKNGENGTWTTVGRLLPYEDDPDSSYYDADTSTPNTLDPVAQNGDIWVRFTRNKYTIQYMYGSFYDYKGTTRQLDMTLTGVLHESDPEYYESLLNKFDSSYTGDDKAYYDPMTDDDANISASIKDNYYFVGWYENPECTGDPYVFTGEKMPLDGKILYAKFAQRGVRVYLHPNAEEGTGDGQFSYTQSGQAENFAKAYGEAVNDGQEIGISRVGYEFVGWYYDEAMEHPYVFETKMAPDMKEAAPYGETEKTNPEYYTDPGSNSDIDRPQVDQMIHLYARWRKPIDGAAGIHVSYEANESQDITGHFGTPGDHTWEDNQVYMDTAKAIARTASTPTNNEDLQFLYWEILKPDGSSYSPAKIVYPGIEFDVLLSEAAGPGNGNIVPFAGSEEQETANQELELEPRRSIAPPNPVRSRVNTTTVAEWTFETNTASTENWLTYDADGDNNNWHYTNDSSYVNSGSRAAESYSYYNSTRYNPDNWFISNRAVNIPEKGQTNLTLYARQYNTSYLDKFAVYISTTAPNSSNLSAFAASATMLESYTPTSTTYTQYTINLDSYRGQTVYIALRHYESYDKYRIFIDDIKIENTITQYQVTFLDYDGTTQLAQIWVDEGGTAVYPYANPERAGYEFTGWDQELTNVTRDITTKATYEQINTNQWRVVFRTSDGVIVDTVWVDKGATLSQSQIPTAPEKTGFTFFRWDKEAQLDEPITDNMVVTAIYHKIETNRYAVNLRAVYGEKQKQPPTHITWYANNGESKTMDVVTHNNETNQDVTTQITVSDYVRSTVERVVDGVTIETQDIITNEAVDIMPADTFTRDGYSFLGWARLDEVDNQQKLQQDLTADDLFLKWCPDETYTVEENGVQVQKTGCFMAKIPEGDANAQWTRVTKVAANELKPYHGLFAVWQRDQFFVVHSSDGTIQAFDVPINEQSGSQSGSMLKSFNLTSLVKTGYLYGGYYHKYGGVDSDAVQAYVDDFIQNRGEWGSATLANCGESAEINANDITGVTFANYDAASVYANFEDLTPYWDAAEAYKPEDGETDQAKIDAINGEHMYPTAGTVYYLKEVPEAYLHSKFVFTYQVKTAGGDDRIAFLDLYLLSVVDDTNYKTVGFRTVSSTEYESAYTETVQGSNVLTPKFTIVQKACPSLNVPQSKTSITPKTVNPDVPRGYVSVMNATTLLSGESNSFSYVPSWVTFDGFKVGNDPLICAVNKTSCKITGTRPTIEKKNILYVNTALFTNEQGNWWINGSVTRAYFFKGNNNTWKEMTQIGSSTYFQVEVPEGYEDGNVIICRCDPNTGVQNDWGSFVFNRSSVITMDPDWDCIDSFWQKSRDEKNEYNQFLWDFMPQNDHVERRIYIP